MDNLQTMSLSNTDSGMTPINTGTKNSDPIVQQVDMDSTPLNEIMGGNEVMGAVDPRAPAQMQSVMYDQAPPNMLPQQQVVQAAPSSGNPMNLTDDQMVALLAGAVAVASFSRPVQEKLGGVVPQFLTETGTRSTIGLATTGAVAAAAFYFGRRMLDKN